MSQLFVNIKNEKIYKLVDFARRKSPDGNWKTEIAYQPEQSNQIYVREVTDFFSKFVPHNCWETANEKQRQDMKNTLGLAEDKPILPESKREYVNLCDYANRPHLILHKKYGKPKSIEQRGKGYKVNWIGLYILYSNIEGCSSDGNHDFYLNPDYLYD